MRRSTFYDSVVIMGPIGMNKPSIAVNTSRKLGYGCINADKCIERKFSLEGKHPFYKNPEFINDPSIDEETIKKEIKRYEAVLLEFLIQSLKEISTPKVISMPGTFGVFQYEVAFERTKEILKKFPNIFLLLPTGDLESNIAFLEKIARAWDGIDITSHPSLPRDDSKSSKITTINKFLLGSDMLFEYNPHVIYTKDKSPVQIAERIKEEVKRKSLF
jgi:hypothetical protein